ncbi:MAG: PASTA domain-containing protein [Elusimicrobia bacterium]|nr:PASTA domain-containing protein [Elusimicrobiota bacterium]
MASNDSPIPDKTSKANAGSSRVAALTARVGPRGGGRRWTGFAALFVAALLATALGLQWAVTGLLHSRKVVVVPDLTGKTLEQALDILSPLQLALSKEAVQFDENSPPGAIVRQAPPAELRVREGKIIRVTLSSGGQVVFVPDVIGVTLTEAQNRLRSGGLSLGAVSQIYSGQHPAGTVMEQTPLASAVVPPNAMVDLKLSKGLPPEGMSLMPDFVNQSITQARQWAEERKIAPEIKEEMTTVFLPGVVIRQFPAPDTAVTEKTAISFVVAFSSGTLDGTARSVRYQLPSGSGSVRVRVLLRDDLGEREVFSSVQGSGTLVDVPVSPQGAARAHIFINGVLVEEREIQ